MIQWQHDDPLPPWTERRKGDRRGHGRPREGVSVDEWVTFIVCVLALAGLIATAIIG